jgi:hypothetical protein
MTYNTNSSREKRERDQEPHPVWRGIGVVMLVLVPIISFSLSDLAIQWMKRERGFDIPDPLAKWSWDIPGYGVVNDALAVVLFALVVMLVVFGVFTIINAFAYRATSDQNLSRFESRPQRYKRKRKLVKPKYEDRRKWP